jgi:hypothetical protein
LTAPPSAKTHRLRIAELLGGSFELACQTQHLVKEKTRMNLFKASLVAIAFLVGICRLSGQLLHTNSSGVVLTNGIGQEKAVSLASHLTHGIEVASI